MRKRMFSYFSLLLLFFISTVTHAATEAPLVLFDQGHDQRFLIQDKGELQLSALSDTIAAQGARVAPLTDEISAASLSGASAIVISGAFAPLKQSEIDALNRFVEKGGRLAVMLHIGQPVADLLHRFEVDISNMVLHEQQNVIDKKDINFQVRDLSSHPIFSSVQYFSLYGGWALNPGGKAQGIARTSNQAWVDLDGDKKLSDADAVDTFTVVVEGAAGAGGFIFFGDDAIFQNRYLDRNNKTLAVNLGKWLINR